MKTIPSRQNALTRALIIHSEGNSFNNPTLKCVIDLLLEKGCEIDIRYRKSAAPMRMYEKVRLLPYGAWYREWKRQVFDKFSSRTLAYLTVLAEQIFCYRKYDLIIGVDRQGLIEAGVLNKITRTPYVFISFEIMFEAESSSRYKSLEREASKHVAAWIVQDEVRAQQLQRENHLESSNRLLLPLASAGAGVTKADRLRDRLGIPEDKLVAIFMGSVESWAMTSRILRSVSGWPEEWVLVVHERFGQTRKLLAGELASHAALLDRRIFVSDAATEMVDDMGGILAGVSAGLAFYQPEYGSHRYGSYIGKNLQYLGMASGKISTCLRYGVPVIMNEIGLYAEAARQFRFGCVVQQPEQIADCLGGIGQEEFRHNARNYFAGTLDFNNYRDTIWSRLEASAS